MANNLQQNTGLKLFLLKFNKEECKTHLHEKKVTPSILFTTCFPAILLVAAVLG